ncbi:MAG: 23S rRNA (pseudouridine(1915)-N(3))-methyltransferase RlmH [Bacteroidales bacterium]|nr:23S rRNA (pseudouridine(1915)-N(3))-methyltransferase RlmH [Bacteroidales bacterium]
MRMILLTVGKTDVPWVRAGLDLYASRLQHYVRFELREIPELKNVSALSEEQIKVKEGALILKESENTEMILLDEHGKEFRSLEFAKELQNRMNRGGKDICFVVGGAYGFSPEVYAKASGKISLSKMTFSHQMVRTIFAEQLYRAFTIIKGEPYHHE